MRLPVKLFSIMTVALMLLTAVPAFAAESTAENSSAGLPATYRIDQKYIEPIRNQGTEGICWAFGCCSVLETELLQKGYDYSSTILSPLYQSYSVYDGTEYSGSGDSLVLLEGRLGHVGTYSFQVSMMLANGIGPMYEFIAPYSEVNDYSLGDSIAKTGILAVREIKVYDPATQADEIKKLIYSGHSGSFQYYAVDGKNNYAPCLESISSNHAVALIGWDDTYSKNNFKADDGTCPEGDGAWIIKNSWGNTGTTFDGYTYVSYYSSIENVAFYTDVTINDGSLQLYSYDNGYSVLNDKEYRGSATMANVFTCEKDGYIDSASFSTYLKNGLNEDYTFTVYKLDDDYSSPTDGKVVAEGDTRNTEYCNGVFNCYFTPTEPFHKGDKFSVCVELKGDTVYVPIDTCESFYNNHVSYTVAEKGQSYILYDGVWTDVSADGKSNVRIKAYISSGNGYEASVNGTYYEKFTDALKNAESGDVISLLKDVSCDALIIDKDLEIRLRGYNLDISTESDDEPAVTVSDCDVTIEYGRIRTSSECTVRTDGGSFEARYIEFASSGTIIDSEGTDVSVYNITYSGDGGSMSFSGGKAVLSNCMITSSDKDHFTVGSDGCEAVFDGGTYTNVELVQQTAGDIKVRSGRFSIPLEDVFIDDDSYNVHLKKGGSFVGTREIYVEGHPELKMLSEIEDAGNGAVGVLQKDIADNSTIETYSGEDLTVDLNGHDYSAEVMIGEIAGGRITIINGSDIRSTVSVNFLVNTANDVQITIGDNIDVVCSNAVCSDCYQYVKITLSEKSTIRIVEETTGYRAVYTPYITDGGRYCERMEITVFGEGKSVWHVYNGVSEDIIRNGASTRYTAEGTYSDAQGNVLGTWYREYNIEHGKGTDIPVVDMLTDRSGKISFVYKDEVSDSIGAVMYSTGVNYNGTDECTITTVMTGFRDGTISSAVIEKAIGYNQAAEKVIKGLAKDVKYRKCLQIRSEYGVDKVLDAERFNALLEKGYDIGVSAGNYSYTLKSGTGKLAGDTVIHLEKAGCYDLNKKQDEAVGAGVAYSIYATVDGAYSETLPCECMLDLCGYSLGGSKVSVVNEDGSLKDLDVRYSENGKDLYFTVDMSCTVAVDADPAEEKETTDNVVIVISVFAAIIALCFAVAYWRR